MKAVARSRKGFSMGELLVVVAVVSLLVLAGIINAKRQIERGQDAIRKKHLNDLKRAFEDYYNDHECYPDPGVMDTASDCGTANLAPYLPEVPCDPAGKTPYYYVPAEAGVCRGYRLYAALRDTSDLDIARIGCAPSWCGFGSLGYNYGISQGVSVVAAGISPQSTPPPVAQGGIPPGDKACQGPVCNHFDDPAAHGCRITFAHGQCCITERCKQCTTTQCFNDENACVYPVNWCGQQ